MLGDIVDAEMKATMLRKWADDTETPMDRTVAIGDGANDLKMMAAANISIAFRAKPIVREKATYAIDVNDMRAVLPLIGLKNP